MLFGIAKFITISGFDPLKIGGINQSIRMEVAGDLNEFGRLGKMDPENCLNNQYQKLIFN